MATHESGREASLLESIINGDKTIECRLDRGKFADYQPGDHVWLRRDVYRDGKLLSSEPRQALVEVMNVERFPTFRTMLESVGYRKVVPSATSLDTAEAACYGFYSKADEIRYGVLAIHITLRRSGSSP